MNVNIISLQKLNKNILPKTKKQNNASLKNFKGREYSLCAYSKNYYLNKVSFGARTPAVNLIDKIGRENFPSPKIIEKLRDLEYSTDYSLHDIHLEHYIDLPDCSTLNEAKEKYPEFQDVIDAKNIDTNSLNKQGVLYKIAEGKIKDADISTLTLDLLKKYYAKLLSADKIENYWNIAPRSVLKIAKMLNIKLFNKKYNVAVHVTDKTRDKHSKATHEHWKNPEHREHVSQIMKELRHDPNSVFNTEQYREKNSKVIKERHKDPSSKYNSQEYRLKRAQITEGLWQDSEYRDKQIQSRNSEEYKLELSQTIKELFKDPASKYNSEEYRLKRAQISKDLWQEDEYREKQAQSKNSDEYRLRRLQINEAKKEAFKRHPEITDMMSETAQDFPRLGAIIKKQKAGQELSRDEQCYLLNYFKACLEKMPDCAKIIGEEQKKILAQWDLSEK